MPVSKKKAQMTMSEPVVNCAEQHVNPAKRAKKSKVSTNAESKCPSFSRSLLLDEIYKETQTSVETPVDESMPSSSEEGKPGVVRKRQRFEETMGHLFGPSASAVTKSKPRRHWELDTYHALFGPDGQMMMSEHPRHYDIFELHRDMRIRQRKQQFENTHSELFGDTMLKRPASSTSTILTHDRLFGEYEESPESESTRQTSRFCEHWDVFEPYRGMKLRQKKHKRDSPDTHGELFGDNSPLIARKPVKNPPRYSRKTPKIIEDVVYNHLQPLVLGDGLPALKTGKAYPKPNDPPRNPLTGAGYVAPSRDCISMPDRPRVLKAAVDGVTVLDPHDRNPVTGDGMPLENSIVDPGKQLRSSTTPSPFTSQFVITDDLGPPSANSDSEMTRRYSGRRPSDAHVRMFDNPRNPITAVFSEKDSDPDKPNHRTEQRQLTESTNDMEIRGSCYMRKRRVQPAYKERREFVLAWGKLNGNMSDNTCYIGDWPMIRRAAARDSNMSPITGNNFARAKLSDTEEPEDVLVQDAADDPDDDARDDNCSPRSAAADDSDYFYDDDDDDDGDLSGDGAVGVPVHRRRSL